MEKDKLIRVLVSFLFGVLFVAVGLTLCGVINDKASFADGLSKPVN